MYSAIAVSSYYSAQILGVFKAFIIHQFLVDEYPFETLATDEKTYPAPTHVHLVAFGKCVGSMMTASQRCASTSDNESLWDSS